MPWGGVLSTSGGLDFGCVEGSEVEGCRGGEFSLRLVNPQFTDTC